MSRPLGSAAELERRRRRAVEAINGGESPEVVARTFGVARASVYRWLKLSERTDGLAAKPHFGSARRLSPQATPTPGSPARERCEGPRLAAESAARMAQRVVRGSLG